MVDIRTNYGALLVGGLLAFGLSGCVSMQFIVYLQGYSEDPWTKKSLVIVTWLLDLCHSVLVAVAIWESVITSYGDFEAIDTIPWSVGPTVELTAMVAFVVQCFCAHRIYRLQYGNFMIASLVVSLAFTRLVAATVSTAEMLILESYSDFIQDFPAWVFTLGLALSASVDIMIAVYICYFLRSNRSMIPRMNRMIDKLTFWTVKNGAASCLAAIATLISWTVMPHNRIYLSLHFIIAKLHANSLIASLNARAGFREAWKYNTSPSAVISDRVFRDGDDQDGPVNPGRGRRGPYTGHIDAISLEILNAKSEVEVNAQQMLGSEYDETMNIASSNAKFNHITEEP